MSRRLTAWFCPHCKGDVYERSNNRHSGPWFYDCEKCGAEIEVAALEIRKVRGVQWGPQDWVYCLHCSRRMHPAADVAAFECRCGTRHRMEVFR